MQEELMVVTFEAEVKTQESGVALSWRYQVEVSIRPTQCPNQGVSCAVHGPILADETTILVPARSSGAHIQGGRNSKIVKLSI